MHFTIHLEGCGFVKYSQREMALAAINSLNGCYTMRVSVKFPGKPFSNLPQKIHPLYAIYSISF